MEILDKYMMNHGFQVIGSSQRVIAFSAVASGGTGLLNITATAHGLKKNQYVYIASGSYAGVHRILKVVSANIIQIAGTFSATAVGNLELTAGRDGIGFIVNDNVTLVIAEFEPESDNIDAASVMAKKYVNNENVIIPFKKIRITTGNITIVYAAQKASLDYLNR